MFPWQRWLLLTAERLAQAIQKAVTDQTMRQRAADLGAKIRTEDAIANAIAVIEEIKNMSNASPETGSLP
ncbi:hypothetical protein [Anabaena sp. UHCC 0399]|uniref:hypothetical protein n=1 Tax=Anabaena sp. UHCC 0399 TaxID=3110238 RepID=UPI002B21D623|nr:hypothetical protein [Anabaena sp. UHCC 0399]MEA5569004.1 hypothetical protein [Anabaena sp. UHCC 0399]